MRVTLGLLCLLLTQLVADRRARAEKQPPPLRVCVSIAPRTINPHWVTGTYESRLAEAIWEGLTYLDPDTLVPVGGVARSWEVSDDGLTYTFRLRPNAQWSDGKPVTAKDFAWSLRHALLPETQAEQAYALHSLAGARELNMYGSQANRVLGPSRGGTSVLASIARARQSMPLGFDRDYWWKFRQEHRLGSLLRDAEEPLLARLRTNPPERFDIQLLLQIEVALRKEATRRRGLYLDALEKFGVTMGAIAQDDHTLVLQLHQPEPVLPRLLAMPIAAPLRRDFHLKATNRDAVEFASVHNGPYRLVKVGEDLSGRLERSPTYWNRAAIRQAVIEVIVIENRKQAFAAYERNEFHWLTTPTSETPGEIERHADLRHGQAGILYYLRLNCRHPALRDHRVRRALSLAVDREEVIAAVGRPLSKPWARVVPAGMRGYRVPTTGTQPEIKRAAGLLREAGHSRGQGLPPLEYLFNTNRGHQRVAEHLSGHLNRALGVRIKPVNAEWQSYLQRVRSGDYGLARAGWIGDYADPTTFLEMWITGGGNNQTGWSDPEYDRLLKEARAAGGKQERRMALLAKAEERLLAQAPIIPLYLYAVRHLVSKRVQGFHMTLPGDKPGDPRLPNIEDLHPYRGLWIKQDK